MCSTFITRWFTLLPTFASLVSQVDITCFTFRTFSFCHLYFHTFSFSPAKTCTDWNGNQEPSETWKPLWSPQVGGRGSTDAKKPGAGSKPLRRIVSAGCFSCSPKKTGDLHYETAMYKPSEAFGTYLPGESMSIWIGDAPSFSDKPEKLSKWVVEARIIWKIIHQLQ